MSSNLFSLLKLLCLDYYEIYFTYGLTRITLNHLWSSLLLIKLDVVRPVFMIICYYGFLIFFVIYEICNNMFLDLKHNLRFLAFQN